ncbi:MAG: OmpL47-type beta-barrel domain-containing protein [Thermoplasmata archaeon]
MALGIVFLLASVSVAGFTQREAPPDPSEADVSPAILKRALQDPIEVRVEGSSSPVVGLPTRFHVHLTSRWGELTDVELEFEVSERLTVTEEPMAPRGLPKGESTIHGLSILPHSPGFSRLVVRVTGVSPHFGRLGGHAVVYLDVPPEGAGQVRYGNPWVVSSSRPTALVADPLLVPTRETRDHRPLPATDTSVLPSDIQHPRTPLPPQSHASFNVTGQWNYWLEDDATTAPQRWATVQVWDEDMADPDDLLWTGMTDETGNFTSPDLRRTELDGPGNQDVYVRFLACNAAVCVQTTEGKTYRWQTETITVGNEDTIDLGARASSDNQFAQRPFQYINDGWDYAANLGSIGLVLGQVRVLTPGPCTFYSPADDTIHLCADGIDDKSPDDVNHEYAHYVQDKLYGDSFWPSPGGPHTACGVAQHRGLSWTEGFADFFGPRANQEIVDPLDHFYTRPWDGSLFSLDLEDASVCPATVRGDDNELRVATTLWDLTDDVDDGPLDVGIAHAADVILGAIEGCNQSSYRDFYDGGDCNWVDRGNPRFDFLATGFQNTIDYNSAPMAQVTSQAAFVWVGDALVATASATDPDSPVTRMEFGIGLTAGCGNFPFILVDALAPYAVTMDLSSLSDAPGYQVCARGADAMEVGEWAQSASHFGIDRTPPSSTATLSGTLGPGGWFSTSVTVELAGTDATSGIASLTYRLDGGAVQDYTEPFVVAGDGTHTVAFFAVDEAGNTEPVQPLVVLIDTGPPVIQIVHPAPLSFVGQSDVVLQWSVADSGAGVAACAVSLDRGPPVLVEEETSFTFSEVADGRHVAAVSCSDLVDRVDEVEVGFIVDTSFISPTGPLGPTFILVLVGLAFLGVALFLQRRR